MSVQFIGNCEWEAFDAPRWSIDSWGVDRATVPYCGRRDKKETFLNSVKGFPTLTGFAFIRLVTATQSGGTISIPIIDLNFIGFRDGTIPPAKGVDSLTTQTAQGSGTYTHGGEDFQVSGSFVYQAPRTVWTWFETTTPADKSRFNKVNRLIDPLAPENIISYSITDDANGKKKNVPYAAFVAVFNSLVRRQLVSDYVTEPLIPGALWACSATVDYKLIN